MELKIPYEIANKRHNGLVLDIVAKLRLGTSKNKRARAEDLEWAYDWSIRCDNNPPSNDRYTEIQNRKQRLHITLRASIGRWRGYSKTPVWQGTEARTGKFIAGTPQFASNVFPPEILEIITEQVENEFAQRNKIAKMTPEERQVEANKLLGQLIGTPGFTMVSFNGQS